MPLLLLAAALGIAAFLRLDSLHEPSYWLDEMLGRQLTEQAAKEPWWRWLTGLEREHGPLYYASQIFFEGRVVAAVLGLATVVAIFLCFSPTRTALPRFICSAAALLLAISPYAVYYSREARPYALLILLTAILLVLIVREARLRWISIVLIALLYTSAVAAPLVAAAAIVLAAVRSWKPAFMALVVVSAFPLLYRGTPDPSLPSPLPSDLWLAILRTFTVSATGAAGEERTAVAMLIAAIVGASVIAYRARRDAIVVVGLTVLPVVLAVASLRVFGHWYAARYIAPGVVGFVVLAGAGLAFIGEQIARPMKRFAPVAAGTLTLVLVAAVGKETWRAARYEPFQKLDWRAIAAALRTHAKPGDVVIAAEPWSDVSLRYYLHPIPPGVRLLGASSIERASRYAQRPAGTWLITAGYSDDSSVRDWMCGYPVVLASALEGFRLHYAPSSEHLLTNRVGRSEERAAVASLGKGNVTLMLGPQDEPLLGPGWASPEMGEHDPFRWVVSDRATVVLPRSDSIRFSALPLDHPSLAQQTVRLLVNDVEVAAFAMKPQWSEYGTTIPATAAREGLNRVTFVFSRAAAPSSLDPAATDSRTLAAAFDWIRVGDGRELRRRGLPTVRIASTKLIDAKTAWRHNETRFPAAHLRQEELESVLARMGLDPITIGARVRDGSAHLDDIIESVAYGSDCESDQAFVLRVFEVVLDRSPSESEASGLLAALRQGSTRQSLARRVATFDEFRAKILR